MLTKLLWIKSKHEEYNFIVLSQWELVITLEIWKYNKLKHYSTTKINSLFLLKNIKYFWFYH